MARWADAVALSERRAIAGLPAWWLVVKFQ
jgi:hypothetical protein